MKGFWRVNSVVLMALALVQVWGCVPTVAPMPQFMYIEPSVTYLRDGPALNSPVLVELARGDQVEVLENPETGWIKVRAIKVNLMGWIPKDLLVAIKPAERAVAKAPEKPSLPKLYVAVKSSGLREEPSSKSKIIQELEFKKKVEKLDEDGGWVKVRDPESNVTGWMPERHLEAFMLSKPRYMGSGRRSGKPQEAEAPIPKGI